MRKAKFIKWSIFMSAVVLSLTACSNANTGTNTKTAESNQVSEVDGETEKVTETEVVTEDVTEEPTPEVVTEVEITDAHGTVVVPVNPEKVVALDSRAFETLAAWGIELAAAPKGVMPEDTPYVSNEAVQDIGNHR